MNTDTLMLRRALGRDQPEHYVAWATELLCTDVDGPNLRILAGLNLRFDRDDVERYFLLTCGELGLQTISTDAPPLEIAESIYAAFCRQDTSASETIQMMDDLYRSGGQSKALLEPWTRMQDELNWGGGFSYPRAALASLDEAVHREWSLLVRALALDPPDDWLRQPSCVGCGRIGTMPRQIPTLWDRFVRCLGGGPAPPVVCSNCGSTDQRWLMHPEARSQYLKHLESVRQ